MRPIRHLHGLPFTECFEPELQHPLRFFFLCGDALYNLLVESFGKEFLLEKGLKPVLVLGLSYFLYYNFVFVHRGAKLNLLNYFCTQIISDGESQQSITYQPTLCKGGYCTL